MRRYFPYLRGKLNELMALRELSEEIAESGQVIPIIEPVRNNANTKISLDNFTEAAMPFLLVCNPRYGDFKVRSSHQRLYDEIINPQLSEYDNWVPSFQLFTDTTHTAVEQFLERYDEREVALIYHGFPTSRRAITALSDERVIHHAFVGNVVPADHIRSIDEQRRILIADKFRDQPRNADFPPREFFTDMNTRQGDLPPFSAR